MEELKQALKVIGFEHKSTTGLDAPIVMMEFEKKVTAHLPLERSKAFFEKTISHIKKRFSERNKLDPNTVSHKLVSMTWTGKPYLALYLSFPNPKKESRN